MPAPLCQGLWATRSYNASRWLESIDEMVRHWRSDLRVFGFDLRNEIHDYAPGNRVVTWGSSNDITTDWKRATEAGAAAVHAANPGLLILVSGLCFSFDIRQLVRDPATVPNPAQVVYTTHYYSGSRWWKRISDNLGFDWMVVAVLSAFYWASAAVGMVHLVYHMARWVREELASAASRRLLWMHLAYIVSSTLGGWLLTIAALSAIAGPAIAVDAHVQAGCVHVAHRIERPPWYHLAIGLATAGALFAATAVYLRLSGHARKPPVSVAAKSASTTTSAVPSSSVTAATSVELLPSGGAESVPPPVASFADLRAEMGAGDGGGDGGRSSSSPRSGRCACCQVRSFHCAANFGMFLLVTCVGCAILSSIASRATSYEFFRDELDSKWMQGGPPAQRPPLFVGEFGDNYPNDYWVYMIRYLRERRLGWAYWALNGNKYLPLRHLEGPAVTSQSDVSAATFRHFDTDASAAISVGELRNVLDALGWKASMDWAREVMGYFDANRSGVLELDEFQRMARDETIADETYGILLPDYRTLRHPEMMADLTALINGA